MVRVLDEVLPTRPVEVGIDVDERAARRSLRAQVARVERDLQQALVTAFPRIGIDTTLEPPARPAAPRVLSLGELERLRDRLTDKLAEARAQLAERADCEEEARRLLERMLLEPGKHKFVRIANADLGEGGCGVWHVRPRLGLVGMLAGWWQVKLSSGCPLAKGRWPPTQTAMGKRSRKRSSSAPETAEPAAPAPRPVPARPRPYNTTSRSRRDEAPKAPWSPFPLVELCILGGIILIVWGFIGGGDKRGALLGCGFALVSLSSLELAIREHFSGFRSHSSLLAGAAAVIADVPLFFFTKLPQEVLLGVAVAVFGLTFWGVRTAFRRRTGGVAFRA